MTVRYEELAVFEGVGGSNYDRIATATGVWSMVYRYNPNVAILRGPQGQRVEVATPQSHISRLGVVDGELVIEYTCFLGYIPGTQRDNPDRPLRRAYTGIVCGPLVGATESATLGPAGPQGKPGVKGDKGDPGVTTTKTIMEVRPVTDEEIGKIANATAERVFTLPPADWAQKIEPTLARSGTRFQDMLTIHLLNPAFWVGVLQAMGKAARDLVDAKVKF